MNSNDSPQTTEVDAATTPPTSPDAEQSAEAAPMSEPAGWDERYSAADAVWSGDPNEQLVAQVEGLTPGRALELGAGEGADAVWLAQQGWAVTVTDFSSVGLRRAEQAATAAGVAEHMDFRVVDARTVTAKQLLIEGPVDANGAKGHEPRGSWDLVTCFYLHLPVGTIHRMVGELVQVIAPGGTLLIVGHHPDDVRAGVRRPDPALLLPAETIAEAVPEGWRVETLKQPREGVNAEGEPVTVYDAVVVAVRQA